MGTLLLKQRLDEVDEALPTIRQSPSTLGNIIWMIFLLPLAIVGIFYVWFRFVWGSFPAAPTQNSHA